MANEDKQTGLYFDVVELSIPTVSDAILSVKGRFLVGTTVQPRQGDPMFTTIPLTPDPVHFQIPANFIKKDIKDISYNDVIGILKSLDFNLDHIPVPPTEINIDLPPSQRGNPMYDDTVELPDIEDFDGLDEPSMGTVRMDPAG